MQVPILGLLLIALRCAASLAKTMWRSLCQPSSPASDVIGGELARAVPPGHSIPVGAQWLLTADQAHLSSADQATVAEWNQCIPSPSVKAAAAAVSQIGMQARTRGPREELQNGRSSEGSGGWYDTMVTNGIACLLWLGFVYVPGRPSAPLEPAACICPASAGAPASLTT